VKARPKAFVVCPGRAKHQSRYLTTPVGRSFHPKIAGESAAMCGPARGEPIARVEARSNVQDWTGAGTLGGLSAQAVRETGQNGRD
jgi:hypothetical protein